MKFLKYFNIFVRNFVKDFLNKLMCYWYVFCLFYLRIIIIDIKSSEEEIVF